MRLIGRFTASLWLSAGLAGPAILGASAFLAAAAGPASATVTAAANSPGASATVDPSSATPGAAVTFEVLCDSLDASSATFFGTSLSLPEQIPMDKESSGGAFSITVTLPAGLEPGTYRPDMDCSDGSSASATLRVTAFPSAGGAATGDGTTATATNNGLAVGGLALIGIGAVAGGIAMRRRGSTRRS
jgi:hypothetical protein